MPCKGLYDIGVLSTMMIEGHPSCAYHGGTDPSKKCSSAQDRKAQQYSTSGRRASWRSSDIEATFPAPRIMTCPLHGERKTDPREAPPPPPPQLAAVAVHCGRRRNSVSTTDERHRVEWDGPPKVYYPVADTFTNDSYCLTNERAIPPGYGWAEPGKGWTRCTTRTRANRRSPDQGGSCYVLPCAPEDSRTWTVTGNDASQCKVDEPFARDKAWAVSYLSREGDPSRQRRVLHSVAKERPKHRGCRQQESTPGQPRGVKDSLGQRRRNAAQLAETHVMKHVSCNVYSVRVQVRERTIKGMP